jgi:hypothetical protein
MRLVVKLGEKLILEVLLLLSSLLSATLNIMVHKTIILPDIFFVFETISIPLKGRHKLQEGSSDHEV